MSQNQQHTNNPAEKRRVYEEFRSLILDLTSIPAVQAAIPQELVTKMFYNLVEQHKQEANKASRKRSRAEQAPDQQANEEALQSPQTPELPAPGSSDSEGEEAPSVKRQDTKPYSVPLPPAEQPLIGPPLPASSPVLKAESSSDPAPVKRESPSNRPSARARVLTEQLLDRVAPKPEVGELPSGITRAQRAELDKAQYLNWHRETGLPNDWSLIKPRSLNFRNK